jgi:hypothetical protein
MTLRIIPKPVFSADTSPFTRSIFCQDCSCSALNGGLVIFPRNRPWYIIAILCYLKVRLSLTNNSNIAFKNSQPHFPRMENFDIINSNLEKEFNDIKFKRIRIKGGTVHILPQLMSFNILMSGFIVLFSIIFLLSDKSRSFHFILYCSLALGFYGLWRDLEQANVIGFDLGSRMISIKSLSPFKIIFELIFFFKGPSIKYVSFKSIEEFVVKDNNTMPAYSRYRVLVRSNDELITLTDFENEKDATAYAQLFDKLLRT